jgi:hypothetical protein
MAVMTVRQISGNLGPELELFLANIP